MKLDLLMKIALVAVPAFAADVVAPAASSSSVQATSVVASSSSVAVQVQATQTTATPVATVSAPVAAPVAVEAPAPKLAPAPVAVAQTPAPAKVAAPVPVALPLMVPRARAKKVEDESDITLSGKIDIQGTKVLWNNTVDKNSNNLESWFGRGQFSIDAKTKDYEGKITVRAYPSDFGTKAVGRVDSVNVAYWRDTVVTHASGGVTFDTVRTVSTKKVPIVDSIANVDRFELYEAYTTFKGSDLDVKLGRYWSNDRVGMAFGNYADEAPKAQFMPAGLQVNAIEISHTWFENIFARVALESSDPNLNKGSLRANLSLNHLAGIEWLRIGLNYRNNIFDVIKYTDTLVTHNASATVELPICANFRIFTEVGMRNMNSDGNSPDMPITFGAELPGGRILDKILLEGEFFNDRAAVDKKVKKTLGSVFVQKNINRRFLISFGAQSNNNTEDFAMIGRLTALID